MMNPVIAFCLLLMERMALVMLVVYPLSKRRAFKNVSRSTGTIYDNAGIVIIFSVLAIYVWNTTGYTRQRCHC